MTTGIAWMDEPPSGDTPFIPILSPKAGETLQAVSLSSAILGVQTHYAFERTMPCYLDRDQCSGCKNKLARRWKGYLAGFQPALGRFVLIELTRQAYEKARRQLAIITDLRGYNVSLHRHGRARNAAVSVDFRSWCLPHDPKLPKSFDAKAALMRIWSRVGELPLPPQEAV